MHRAAAPSQILGSVRPKAGVGLFAVLLGAVLIGTNFHNHPLCRSVRYAGLTACTGVERRYYGGIVLVIVGALTLLAYSITARFHMARGSAPDGPSTTANDRGDRGGRLRLAETRDALLRHRIAVGIGCAAAVLVIAAIER